MNELTSQVQVVDVFLVVAMCPRLKLVCETSGPPTIEVYTTGTPLTIVKLSSNVCFEVMKET